jgi:hypothetical protein
MTELKVARRQVWECVEAGHIGCADVVHGVYSTEQEARQRFEQVARQRPGLLPMGALVVRQRYAEPVEPVEPVELEPPASKMRRSGVDYQDKMISGVPR